MTGPLATYSEAQIGLQRQFELYDDRVIVNGRKKWLMFTTLMYETPIMLIDLRPVQAKRRFPPRIHLTGYCVAFGAFVSFLVFVMLVLLEVRSWNRPAFLCIAVILGLVAVTICATTPSSIEWTQFQNHQGTLFLGVGRTGPECDKYDAFVELLVRQIEGVQKHREKLLRDAIALRAMVRGFEGGPVHP